MAPVRTCIGCRRTGSVDGLARVVRLDDGSLVVGLSSKGRGAWLCRDSPGCLDQAVKRKAFDRAFRGRVDQRHVDGIRVALGSGSHVWPGVGSESPVL